MGQASERKILDAIHTRGLFVVDEGGKEKAALGLSAESTGLVLEAPAGGNRVTLVAEPDGAFLNLHDSAGRKRLVLFTSNNGAGLVFYDTVGKARMSLLDLAEGCSLDFMNGNKNPLLSLGTLQGEPSLKVSDTQGFSSVLGTIELETPADGTKTSRSAASLVLLDRAQHIIWKAP
jgi:hypothetical protein